MYVYVYMYMCVCVCVCVCVYTTHRRLIMAGDRVAYMERGTCGDRQRETHMWRQADVSTCYLHISISLSISPCLSAYVCLHMCLDLRHAVLRFRQLSIMHTRHDTLRHATTRHDTTHISRHTPNTYGETHACGVRMMDDGVVWCRHDAVVSGVDDAVLSHVTAS